MDEGQGDAWDGHWSAKFKSWLCSGFWLPAHGIPREGAGDSSSTWVSEFLAPVFDPAWPSLVVMDM